MTQKKWNQSSPRNTADEEVLPICEKSGTEIVSAALILAAGFSERMGSPKALLMWNHSTTFLEKIIREYLNAGCEPVICIVNQQVLPSCKSMQAIPGVKIILNRHPERGRMHSVKLGLEYAVKRPYCFVQNVDNPFIREQVIRTLLAFAGPGSWCSPVYQQTSGHPVLLPKKIMEQIIQRSGDNTTLREILRSFPEKAVPINDDSVLRNINTPEDYRMLIK